jgi:hypothetical protein
LELQREDIWKHKGLGSWRLMETTLPYGRVEGLEAKRVLL